MPPVTPRHASDAGAGDIDGRHAASCQRAGCGLTHREVAARAGAPLGTVQERVRIAHRKLAARIGRRALGVCARRSLS